MEYLLQGLLLGFAYVAPIGIQNLYVINISVRKDSKSALKVALVTVFFDISLAMACFFGVGALIDTFKFLKGAILLSGSMVVIYIGMNLIRSHPELASDTVIENTKFLEIIGKCFVITWFNPQAIIDGSLLLGGFYASLPNGMSNYFIAGVCMASFTWFLSLAAAISFFRSNFNNATIKWINIACGLVIIFYGLKLGYAFVQFLE